MKVGNTLHCIFVAAQKKFQFSSGISQDIQVLAMESLKLYK